MKIAYQGMSKTVTELTPDNTGGSKTKITDVFGRLIELQEHQGSSASAVTRYAYDVMDNLKQITDADENITTMKHDWLGHRTKISRGKRQWLFQYDLNGNLINKRSPLPENTNPTPYVISYEYDNLDRLTKKIFVDTRLSTASSTNTPPPTGAMSNINYYYDEEQNGIGHLTRVDLPFGEIKTHYDVRGLITHEIRSFDLNGVVNMSASQLVERSYNALGQLTETNWQDGQRWRISYDERGLVKSVDWFDPTANKWNSVANYQRDLLGLPVTRTTGYGQERLFTYDVLARPLTDNVKLTGSSTTLAMRNYEYTGAGNLDNVVGETNDVNANASYTYDLQHRLLRAEAPNGYRGNFKYSSTGNILSADVAWNNSTEARNVQYRYGDVDAQAVDELTNIATVSTYAKFLYDDSGNMTSRNTANGNSLIHWDGLDQIRRVDTPNSSETYYYDHNGQRMLAVNPTQGVRFWFGEKETHYNLNGSEKLNYLHLSAGGPVLARIENGEKIELQYADALQNLMFSLDKDSNVVASFLYGPFGEVVAETGGEAHRRQFNGKEHDLATGLRYYGYRYYDPLILRWNSADPLYTLLPELGKTQPQRMNLYAFSLNNPVRYYDPDGRNAKDKGKKEEDPFGTDKCNFGSGCCNAPKGAICEEGESDSGSQTEGSTDEFDPDPDHAERTANNFVELHGKRALEKNKEAYDKGFITFTQMISISKEIRRLLNPPAKMFDPKNPPPLTALDKHNVEVRLRKKELDVVTMNFVAAGVRAILVAVGVDRETAADSGKLGGMIFNTARKGSKLIGGSHKHPSLGTQKPPDIILVE